MKKQSASLQFPTIDGNAGGREAEVGSFDAMNGPVVLPGPPVALPEADEFHLDPGRMCVLLTRHRQACVVVGRRGDRELVADRPPPPTAAYLGHDPDPVLDGWEAHEAVFAALEPHLIAV